jgi:hypothetical protein
MTDHAIGMVLMIILGGATSFVLGWYLLGVGIGIAQRGYNRVAPYRILTRVVPSPTFLFQARPSTWDDWDSATLMSRPSPHPTDGWTADVRRTRDRTEGGPGHQATGASPRPVLVESRMGPVR